MALVAQITKDPSLHDLYEEIDFSYIAFKEYWESAIYLDPPPTEMDLVSLPNTKFRLYDDDGILYYSGWLKNDEDELLVQQFVLLWAMADSGCTRIDVKINGEWKTEIG